MKAHVWLLLVAATSWPVLMEQKGSDLRFTQMAGTLMACVSPFMELESQVLKILNTTSGYRIEGQHLILLDGEQELASFETVYLR